MTEGGGITAIVVTHNSPPILERVVRALLEQTLPPRHIVLVDSGSTDPEPVKALASLDGRIHVICRSNIGFSMGNNVALREYAGESEYFALVNPDAILSPDWLRGASIYMASEEGVRVGILSSPLQGMNAATGQPTGLWDSLGIYRKWNGRWHDRGSRVAIADMPAPEKPYEPQAVCGALMFFSNAVFREAEGPHGFFDERFHTYKEDIEVSLRVRRAGYRIVVLPQLRAWHCRGWPKARSQTSFWARRLSARNDLRIAALYTPSMLPIYLCKYLYVMTMEWFVILLSKGGSAAR